MEKKELKYVVTFNENYGELSLIAKDLNLESAMHLALNLHRISNIGHSVKVFAYENEVSIASPYLINLNSV